MTDTMTSQNIDLSSWDILYFLHAENVDSKPAKKLKISHPRWQHTPALCIFDFHVQKKTKCIYKVFLKLNKLLY
jgi:hypothetical protein